MSKRLDYDVFVVSAPLPTSGHMTSAHLATVRSKTTREEQPPAGFEALVRQLLDLLRMAIEHNYRTTW